MKYIKYSKDFPYGKSNSGKDIQLSQKEIDSIKLNDIINDFCRKYFIRSYRLNNDMTIDIEGDVDISFSKLESLPINFGIIYGDFNCSHNNLVDLNGCPKEVSGDFNCSHNQLTSLENCPKKVGGSFKCNANRIKSLKGIPNRVGGLLCGHNKIENLEGLPNIINGYLSFTYNDVGSLKFLSNVYVKGEIRYQYNPLPEEIIISCENFNIKDIIKWQDDYCIWNKDETLNIENFKELLDNIK